MLIKIKKTILKRMIKFLLTLNTYTYDKASILSVKLENGLHPKHRIMNYSSFFIKNITENETVLDVGCGNGFNTFNIAKKAKKIVGIDINANNIEFARKNYKLENINYIHDDILNYSFTEKFDVIVLSNVLEHVENRIELLKRLNNIGNKLLIRVPLIDRSWITLYKKEMGLDYMLDKTHYIEYTVDSFLKEIEESGLKTINYSIQFGEIWAVVK